MPRLCRGDERSDRDIELMKLKREINALIYEMYVVYMIGAIVGAPHNGKPWD